jgi:hypothetical protein
LFLIVTLICVRLSFDNFTGFRKKAAMYQNVMPHQSEAASATASTWRARTGRFGIKTTTPIKQASQITAGNKNQHTNETKVPRREGQSKKLHILRCRIHTG